MKFERRYPNLVIDICEEVDPKSNDLFASAVDELCSSPDGFYLSKSKKSELLPLLESRTVTISNASTEFYKANSIAIFDFMAEARKIESRRKKFGFKTFGDAKHLGKFFEYWQTCRSH